jgi:transposase
MKKEVITKMRLFMPYLNENQRRLYVASEAKALGYGGKSLIEKELGISHNTINSGIAELESCGCVSVQSRQRQEGGGRKKTIKEEEWKQIESFIQPYTRGEPESALQWVSKSLRHISTSLKSVGILASHRIIGQLF